MATDIRSAVIAKAKGEVGYQRKSNRWNKYAAAIWSSLQYQPYCGIFVTWVIAKALNVDIKKVVTASYVPYIEKWAKKNGAWKTSGQKDGDLVVFDWGGDGLADHVGIAWRDEKATGYRSIEANTSAGSGGSQSNGGGVHIRYRGRKSIRGWVDLEKLVAAAGGAKPIAKTTSAAKASGGLVVDGRWGRKTTRELQQRMKTFTPSLSVDGRAGSNTWKALQAHAGTTRDGVISHQSHKADSLGNGIVPGKSWDYDGAGAKGSTVIKHVQKRIGVTADGVVGEKTIKALQRFLNENPGAFTTRAS